MGGVCFGGSRRPEDVIAEQKKWAEENASLIEDLKKFHGVEDGKGATAASRALGGDGSTRHKAPRKRASFTDNAWLKKFGGCCSPLPVTNGARKPALKAISTPVQEATDKPGKQPRQNLNCVTEYKWLLALLQRIADGQAASIAVASGDRKATPLFVAAGGCPNWLCGMQAVVYCQVDSDVDFWWIKPRVGTPDELEWETVNCHDEGPFRNVADSSKTIYAPLAQKFKGSTEGSITFGVDSAGRAFLEETVRDGYPERMLVYLIWQEQWEWSNFMSSKGYVRGKICYQRNGAIYTRQYCLCAGHLEVAGPNTEESLSALLPDESFQEMYLFT